MGQLLDKLDRAAKGTVQPLGFGAASKREEVAPMLLIGVVAPGDDAQAKLVLDASLDAAIVLGLGSTKANVEKSAKSLKDTTTGVWQDEATTKDTAGTDFQVFSAGSTPIGSLGDENRTNVMQVDPEMDDSLLRAIDYLPVDAFLVSLTDTETLTLNQLMRLGMVRGVTSRWILAHLAMLPVKEELEQLRELGVSGIVVDVAGKTAKALKECRQALLELPHEQPERNKSRSVATLPSVGLRPRSEPTPAPEPDDDDYDDD
jgi:hypothetical protein